MTMDAKLGICQWSIPASDVETAFAMAVRVGLKGIEPDLGKVDAGFPLSKPDEKRRYAGLREQYGVVYPALAVNALCDYGMSDASARPVVEQALARAVETAVALDIPIVQLPSFVKGDISTDEDLKNTIACMRFACQQAEGTGVIIGSENALPVDKQMIMLNEVASDHFKIYFDTRNLFAMKDLDSVTILKTMLPWVCQVHIKDGMDGGPSMLLGKGNSGFEASMRVLAAADYDGWLLLENDYIRIAEDTGVSPETALSMDVDIAKSSL